MMIPYCMRSSRVQGCLLVPVMVLIFHAAARTADGPLSATLQEARRRLAERHRVGFLAAGADEARVVEEAADDTPFGYRLRRLAQRGELGRGGVVLLGSGAVPLATAAN